METTRIIGGIAFVAAFFAASLLALWIAGCARRSRHGSEAALLSGADSSRMQHLLRNGIPSLKPLSNELLKIRVIERFIERLQNALAERDTETYPQSLASLLLGGALAILILGSALSASFVFALTGYSLPQIFEQVAQDLEGPLKQVFQKSAAVVGAGGTVEEALEVLKSQTHEPELFFLATALEIQHRTGSSLSQVLEVVRQSVDDQLELKRLLQTQTAQAKLSAQIVTIMPFLIIGVFSLISEGFLEPFFTSVVGIILLAIAIAMQAGGILLVRKLLKVEVA